MVGLHASFTVEDETLSRSVELSKDYGVGVHIHCAEDRVDQEKSLKKYGQRVVERLNAYGALEKRTIAVHRIHLDEGELEILRETDTNVAHNPESNMNNAVGYADVPRMINRGIKVGLGTDGMSSDMLAQLRCAYLLHPHERKDPRVGFRNIPRLLLENNPEIVERITGWKVGKIAKGFMADIIMIDYLPPTSFNEKSFLGHLIYGLVGAPVDTTICNGKVLMRDKKLVDLDEGSIVGRARDIAFQIWKTISET